VHRLRLSQRPFGLRVTQRTGRDRLRIEAVEAERSELSEDVTIFYANGELTISNFRRANHADFFSV
jgi:hypothetical protein